MQGLTTQKHDFVPKFQFQRVKCSPRDNIGRAYGCSERSTVQGLSYMKPDFCNFSKAVSFKPMVSYKRPESESKMFGNFTKLINLFLIQCRWSLKRPKSSASCRSVHHSRKIFRGHAKPNTARRKFSSPRTPSPRCLINRQAALSTKTAAAKSSAMMHRAPDAELSHVLL